MSSPRSFLLSNGRERARSTGDSRRRGRHRQDVARRHARAARPKARRRRPMGARRGRRGCAGLLALVSAPPSTGGATRSSHGRELARTARELGHPFPARDCRCGTVRARAKPAPSLQPEEQRFALFDTLTILFQRAAKSRPMLLVIDDLHAADGGGANGGAAGAAGRAGVTSGGADAGPSPSPSESPGRQRMRRGMRHASPIQRACPGVRVRARTLPRAAQDRLNAR